MSEKASLRCDLTKELNEVTRSRAKNLAFLAEETVGQRP